MIGNIKYGIFVLSILAGVLLLIYAFVGWRFDIILFGLSNYELYFFYGVGAVAIPFLLFIWGYTFGLGVSVLSLLVLLYFFILNVLLDKNNEHDVPPEVVQYCLIALGSGLVGMFFGSKEVHEEREAREQAKRDHDNSPVICAKCDQYLGIAKGFSYPIQIPW